MENKYILDEYEVEEYQNLRKSFDEETDSFKQSYIENTRWVNRVGGYAVGLLCGILCGYVFGWC